MKRFTLFAIFLAILILFYSFSQTIQIANSTFVSKYLAIIVLGYDEFASESERCYNLMSMWKVNGTQCYEIMYLSSNLSITPRANMIANKSNFQWALTNWLKNRATPDTQVWIWIFSHGVGLHHHSPLDRFDDEWWSVDGRVETPSDEGPEINEALIGGSDRWVGVDEGIRVNPPSGKETVWDDDFKDWLAGVNYRRMMIFLSTCRSPEPSENETESCYGGGFIDDLSAPRRIIISCTNETYYGWGNETTGIGFFSEPFMDALTLGSPAWYEACNLVDYDGIPSVLEAYVYAFEHDMARKAVRNPSGDPNQDPWRSIYKNWREIDESPWFDDGGNFLPTFRNGTDVGDSSYGWLSACTWLVQERYSSCVEDVNDDYKVDSTDRDMVAQNYGRYFPGKWNSQCSLVDLNEDDKVDMLDYTAILSKFNPVCAMKTTTTNGYFYVPNVTDLLRIEIEMLFDNQNITGDQTGGTSPYGTIATYPDGKVDIHDVSLVSSKYGFRENRSGWDYMADVYPDRKIDIQDTARVSANFGKFGTYITSLAGVTVTFSTGEEKSPDSDGFVVIPQGATNFTVKRNGTLIGAMITFW